jgi:hypothetical protein
VAGYDLLECSGLDEAVRWAGKHPSSWAGAIEVRALPEHVLAVRGRRRHRRSATGPGERHG